MVGFLAFWVFGSAALVLGAVAGSFGPLAFLIVLFFDLTANPAGNARADKTVHQVNGEQGGQNVIEDLLAQDHNEAEE